MSHILSDTQPAPVVAPVPIWNPGEYQPPFPLRRLLDVSDGEPFSLAATLAQIRQTDLNQSGFFAIELPHYDGRKAHLWSYADVPLTGDMKGHRLWDSGNGPSVLSLVSLRGEPYPLPTPLVFIVRRGHEEGDFAALDAELSTNGYDNGRPVLLFTEREEGEPEIWIKVAVAMQVRQRVRATATPTAEHNTGGRDNG